jgi:hypothetical protein
MGLKNLNVFLYDSCQIEPIMRWLLVSLFASLATLASSTLKDYRGLDQTSLLSGSGLFS